MVDATTRQTPGWLGLPKLLSAITGRWCVDGLVWCRGGFTLEGVGTELVHPLGLRDVAFSGLKHKKCYSHFGPIASYVIQTMMNVEKHMGFKSKWHRQSPIWHNGTVLYYQCFETNKKVITKTKYI